MARLSAIGLHLLAIRSPAVSVELRTSSSPAPTPATHYGSIT